MRPPGPALLLGLLLLVTASTEDVNVLNALVGGTIDMVPVFSGGVEGFEWKKGTNKIIEVDFPGEPMHYVLKDRSNLNLTTGVLTIRHLQFTDLGNYTADVLVNGQYQKSTFRLLVFPTLNKPTVRCTGTETNVLIRCHHDPDPPTYDWNIDDKPITSSHHDYNLTDQNRNLTIGRAGMKNLKSIECVVKNPVTENKTSVPETCSEKEYNNRSRDATIAAVVVVVIFLLLFLTLYGLYKRFCKPKQGYDIAATNNPEGDQNSVGGPPENGNKDRAENEENRSSREPKLADSVPNYPSAPLQADRTEGDGSADEKKDAPESPPAPSKPNQNETASKEEMQIPFADDGLLQPSKETLNSKES